MPISLTCWRDYGKLWTTRTLSFMANTQERWTSRASRHSKFLLAQSVTSHHFSFLVFCWIDLIPAILPTIGSSDVCGICLKDIDDLAECTVTRCKHTFHKMCVMGHIREAETNEEPVNCPVCFQEISMAIQIRGASDADVSSSEPSTGPAACVVCLDKPRDAVCLPCGHMHTCSSCAAKLPTRTCPLCRQRITKVVKATKSALKAIPRKGAADQLLSGDEEASSTKLSLKLGWNNILQR